MFFYRMSRYRWFATLVSMLLAVVIVLSAITSQVRADSTYAIPDVMNNFLSYAVTLNNDNPVLSYYSSSTNKIVVAICGNPACEPTSTVIRPIESILLHSVAVTVINGNPFIAYSTSENPGPSSHLRVAACVDPLCAQPPVITTLDNGAIWEVAITLQNGKALIAYENASAIPSHNFVTLAFCNDAACTAPTLRPLSLTDGISGAYGMGVGLLNGSPIVVYTIWYVGSVINMLKCASVTCAETSTVKTVDANVSAPAGIALTVSANTPIISYTTVENSTTSLKVATCTDSACNDPMDIHTVDETAPWGDHGLTSVSLINGLPVILYFREGVRIATCLDIACANSSSTPIADSTHDSPVIRASQNDPLVTFLQRSETTQDRLIKVYFGGDFPPTPTSPPNAAPKINFYTTHTPTLTWTRVTFATGYQLQISTDKNFAPTLTVTKFLPVQPLAYTTDSLTNGTYYWRVKALGSTVAGWSNPSSFVISAPPTP